MRFGMFDILRWHKDWTAERAFDASLEQIELADKLGLQDIWLGEHHFSRHGMLSGHILVPRRCRRQDRERPNRHRYRCAALPQPRARRGGKRNHRHHL